MAKSPVNSRIMHLKPPQDKIMIEMIDIGIENARAFRMFGKITESDMSLVFSDVKAKTDFYDKIVIYEENMNDL